MRRRELITLLGGAAAWPIAARGQQAGKLPTIGFLGASTSSAARQWSAAFVQRQLELGWIEGRTVANEYRWAEGRTERFAEIVAELFHASRPRHLMALGIARHHTRRSEANWAFPTHATLARAVSAANGGVGLDRRPFHAGIRRATRDGRTG
jgi:hypothetical protein